MKLQYKINELYDKNETLKVAGILLRIMMRTIRALKDKIKHFEPKDLVFYPLNTYEIGRGKKLILLGSDKAKGVMEYIDQKFMDEVSKEGLQVQREEVR